MRIRTDRVVQPEPVPAPARADESAVQAKSAQLRVVDEALARFAHRDLVAGTEVVDFLLDLRSTMVAYATFAEVVAHDSAL